MMTRPDPEVLLSRLKEEEVSDTKGRLKVFFGAVAGVGKTYAMLESAHKQQSQNVDVIVGYVETHGRKETDKLLEGLEILAPKIIEYKGTQLREFDIDAVLSRKPQLVLVDELAHTNAPGSRHAKRWQDVLELLEHGIDVYTTMNVQHVESLHDVVAQITRVSIRERVPDFLLERAREIELIDLPPDELLERLKEGKVYVAVQAHSAMQNFFRKGNLIALRELVLRYLANRVEADMDAYRQVHDIKHPWPATERILVCVSPSPLASKLVRAGKRMADALRAKWTVLYVEGSHSAPISMADKNRVIQTLRLAEQLGAETLELSGVKVSEEIIKCGRAANVSKIIIGKSTRARWREFVYGNVVDEVIRMSGALDVYVITGDEGDVQIPAGTVKPQLWHNSKPPAYLQAFGIIILFTFLARLLSPFFELSNVVMFYLLGVIIVAVRCGRGPSVLASILSVATFDFFCVPPYLTFAVSDTQYIITFAVMLIVALVISSLTVTIKQQAETARFREIRTAALYSMSRDLSSAPDVESILSIGLKHLTSVFDCQAALFMGGSDANLELACQGENNYKLGTFAIGVAGWVYQNKQSAGLGTATLPGASELYLPLLSGNKSLGVLAVKPLSDNGFLSPEQLRLLETFANQIALSCGRALLAEENEHARVQVKTEQLRNSLLSSVSHDLRTPLATIAGVASSILDSAQPLKPEKCNALVEEIFCEAMRLNRLVTNLLDMTRLESRSLELKCEFLPVDEVIGTALTYLEDKLVNFEVKTSIPSELPLIYVDAILIQQVLVNLIENAMKYALPQTPNSKGLILVGAEFVDGVLSIFILDSGPGISGELKKKVFEKFFRINTNISNGAGLGLAICSGIVQAHGGEIWVEDNPGGGATFKFTIGTIKEETLRAEYESIC